MKQQRGHAGPALADRDVLPGQLQLAGVEDLADAGAEHGYIVDGADYFPLI